ncbi:hypothetical protein HG536_0B04650 [Torulaspora globosa]|uniref:Enolase-phosphatase E1 n=1 Tax=Torulaspora globosa TaxID=48254 RepID=A0A7G3ZDL5_9SACH|nr:uncharacterized protein HG536_0B04650 [Torulaspora globosa]QLL31601.1 hypothetical protein HG536_0B04650 [Torulaspora globosa]
MSSRVLLLDIEGTVCPIAFVKEVLFPFFSGKVPSLVSSGEPAVEELLTQFPQDKQQCLQEYILELVDRDIKDPVLKQLQGHVWAQGYEQGEIKAPVYRDAIELIRRGGEVYIYSSGSVKAQKLLFGHVADPDSDRRLDLQPFIRGYFDINTSGKKTEAESYRRILKDMGREARDVLFISDNELELDAASEAGLNTLLAVRPGNAPISSNKGYEIVKDYSAL